MRIETDTPPPNPEEQRCKAMATALEATDEALSSPPDDSDADGLLFEVLDHLEAIPDFTEYEDANADQAAWDEIQAVIKRLRTWFVSNPLNCERNVKDAVSQ